MIPPTYTDKKNTIQSLEQGTILDWLEGFMLDRRSRRLSQGTITYYKKKLNKFAGYLTDLGLYDIEDITPAVIRTFIVWLEDQGHNKGGVITFYKCLRSFFKWYQSENDLKSNPMDKVKLSTKLNEPMDPANIEDIKKMIAVSSLRNKAIFFTLLDTGLRASELLSITMDNINPITGVIRILHGKGDKPRTVYVGKKTRLAIRKYLKSKPDTDYLFTIESGEPLTYWGLRMVMVRSSKVANVKTPSIHSFRRLFALTMLRNGVDIYSLQLLMGHSDLQVLRRYLKQTDQDTLEAHLKGCPVEKLL